MDPSLEKLIMTDAELARLSSNTKEYFSILIERYEKKITRYVSRITRVNKEDQEDIIQNIFIKAYININSFDTSLSFNSWMYRIAHNEVIDWSRKVKTKIKYGHYDYDNEVLNWAADTNHFLQDLEIKDIRENIEKTIHLLELKYREVLYLRYVEDYSYEEISDILKKPSGTIATLINRAKKKFKEIYEYSN